MNEQLSLQKALFTIKKLKTLLQDQSTKPLQPVAIVGLSCRFPQAIGKEAYWQLLCEGKNVISPLPEARWQLLKGSAEELLRDSSFPYWGGYLTDIDLFDSYFFGISPREAVRMDPQHRLLLEVVHEAIEDAGFPVEALAGSNTGVFASLDVPQLAHLQKMENDLDALYLPTGNAISIAANRISYLFDLQGPSMVLDSACSSSMTALHIACVNLQQKLCDVALVCGAKLNLLPYVNYVLAKAKMLSPDGQCKTFDANANGYVQGEGVGVLVLKPLDKALQNNDRIYGVIMGSSVNQDGKTNGLTAPNGRQQEKLLQAAYSKANIDPHNISYIECHGTGTFLGDPIEIQALGEVLGKTRSNHQPCWIGSAKTNIGHLEPAAGVASVIKVALALKHSQIPPHLNLATPNPHLAFDKYQLRVPKQLENWPQYGPYRIAGISGFGFGGTNAHVVLRELSAEEKQIKKIDRDQQTEVFTLSAKDPTALQMLIARWHQYLSDHLTIDLAQLCYNVHLRRSHYSYRLAIVADTTFELFERLGALKNSSLDKLENSAFTFINLKKEAPHALNSLTIEDLKNQPTQLALAYVNRANINWASYEETRCYPLLEMPLYPWQHKKYWPQLVNNQSISQEATRASVYPLQGKKIASPLKTIQFEFNLSINTLPDLKDTHNVLHVGYYLEIIAYAIDELYEQMQFTVEDFAFLSPLIVPDDKTVSVQLVLENMVDKAMSFHFYSRLHEQQNWVQHAHGKLTLGAAFNQKIDLIDTIKARSLANQTADKLYDKVNRMGMSAGNSIRWTKQFWAGQNELLCEFEQPKAERENKEFKLKVHPGIVDGSVQPLLMLLPENNHKPCVAANIGKIKFFGMKEGPMYLLATLKEFKDHDKKMICNLLLMNQTGELVLTAEEICLTQLDNKFEIKKLMQTDSEQRVDLSSLSLAERKHTIINFLTEQVAALFAMPKEDIKLDHSLNDMGMDSLSALSLMRDIEQGFGCSYSMQDLLQNQTIAELANLIAGSGQLKEVATNRWTICQNRRANPKVRLFCFPYGGGGASIYHEWQKNLPDSIEVCAIQLPGRENRMHEEPIRDFDQLITQLIADIQPELNLPFAFFGHSFGSLIAFELGRQLRKRHLPKPIHLFASAFPDPALPTKNLDNLISQLSNINLSFWDLNQRKLTMLSDEDLHGVFNVFNENGMVGYNDFRSHTEMLKMLLPVFIGDMHLVKSYQYYHDLPLEIPITVFLGKKDTWVAHADHLTWASHTHKKCEFHEFDSGHLFIKEDHIKAEVLQTIAKTLNISVAS